MPVPKHVFDPPFNVIRSSHAVLDVTDLDTSREFYETTVGLHVEDRDDKAVYLRGSEEHQHHSLVLRKAAAPACNRLGFKVGDDGVITRLPSTGGVFATATDAPSTGPTSMPSDTLTAHDATWPRARPATSDGPVPAGRPSTVHA